MRRKNEKERIERVGEGDARGREEEEEKEIWKKRRCIYICEVLYVPWRVSQGGGTCVSECFARMPGKREKSVRNPQRERRVGGREEEARTIVKIVGKSVSRLGSGATTLYREGKSSQVSSRTNFFGRARMTKTDTR